MGLDKIIRNTYFAVSENGEKQRQTFHYKLLTVVIGTNLQEILKQLIDDRIQAELVGSCQRIHPTMKRPRDTHWP